MTPNHAPTSSQNSAVQHASSKLVAPITIFALPKPFSAATDTIQRNAIESWRRLAPQIDVLLIGDEAGIEATANELGVHHAGNVQRNESGTPLISSAFEIARQHSDSPILVYCNADVILLQDFVDAISGLQNSELDSFLAIGRRTDLQLDRKIDFDSEADIEKLMQQSVVDGEPASIVCKEYFAFPRDAYSEVPDFAVGRGNWDNWMVANAKSRQIPVVNLSQVVNVIHQSHDYAHIATTRMQCYVNGVEARENQRLAGGRHLISGSTSTHRMTPDHKVERAMLPSGEFFRDLPRFGKLMLNLLWQR